jgi:hypothetical protein
MKIDGWIQPKEDPNLPPPEPTPAMDLEEDF